jgi:divalent anion:Na+ symporter, DASS family
VKPVLPIAIGLVIWFLPVPDALGPNGEPLVAPNGMHMLGIFVATIVGLITRPLPTAAVSIIGLSVAMLTGTMPLSGTPSPASRASPTPPCG